MLCWVLLWIQIGCKGRGHHVYSGAGKRLFTALQGFDDPLLATISGLSQSWLENFRSERYFYLSGAWSFSRIQLFATLWTVAHQAPLYTEFSRQGYWNSLPFPPAVDLPDPGIKPVSIASPTLAGKFLPQAPPGKSFIFLGMKNYSPHPSYSDKCGEGWVTDVRTRNPSILI